MNSIFLLVMLAAVVAMMLFGVRKQKAQMAQVQKMQDALQPGTRVMTTSGLHGTVVALADDTIELEIAEGVRTTWTRAAVREVVAKSGGVLDAAGASALESGAGYQPTQYGDADYTADQPVADTYGADAYSADTYGADAYGTDPHRADGYSADSYGAEQYSPDQYADDAVSLDKRSGRSDIG